MSPQTSTPVTKWLGHPNLRLRPVKPAKGNGRIQRQVRRAFMVGGPVLTSSQVYDWARSARAPRFGQWERWSITKVLLEVADQIGHASTRGNPWIWRLKTPAAENKS
jgi:hypothetical protein